MALKASNGRYVCMKKNGQLAAISDFVGEHSPPALGSLGLGALPGDSSSSAHLHPGLSPLPPHGAAAVCDKSLTSCSSPLLLMWGLRSRAPQSLLHFWGTRGSHKQWADPGTQSGQVLAWRSRGAAGRSLKPLSRQQGRTRSSPSSLSTGPSWSCAAWTASSATDVAPTSWTPTARFTMCST